MLYLAPNLPNANFLSKSSFPLAYSTDFQILVLEPNEDHMEMYKMKLYMLFLSAVIESHGTFNITQDMTL